jgi:hypothetical protein
MIWLLTRCRGWFWELTVLAPGVGACAGDRRIGSSGAGANMIEAPRSVLPPKR